MTEEEKIPEGMPENEVESLRKELVEEQVKAASCLAGWQRSQADFANFKKRSDQEREETIKFANSELVSSLLPVLDDLERAFSLLPAGEPEPEWVAGVRMIERKLRATLEAAGLSPIEALGKPFDPCFHEAMAQCAGEEGVVAQELQKGYMFRDRVLRPSRVIVGCETQTT